MKRIEPKVPQGRKLIGSLYQDDDSRVMSEDMAEVQLANDVLVYAGWYERWELKGHYRVVASRELNELCRCTTTDIDLANWLFEMLADKYNA